MQKSKSNSHRSVFFNVACAQLKKYDTFARRLLYVSPQAAEAQNENTIELLRNNTTSKTRLKRPRIAPNLQTRHKDNPMLR